MNSLSCEFKALTLARLSDGPGDNFVMCIIYILLRPLSISIVKLSIYALYLSHVTAMHRVYALRIRTVRLILPCCHYPATVFYIPYICKTTNVFPLTTRFKQSTRWRRSRKQKDGHDNDSTKQCLLKVQLKSTIGM